MLKNKTYDKIKYGTTIVLPALGALYSGLALLWGFPYGTEVAGSVALVATAGGTIMGVSSLKYNALTDDQQPYEGQGDDWPDDKENTG